MNTDRLDTLLVHAGRPEPRVEGAIATPIFQTAMYEYGGEDADYHALRYIRLNNTPNHVVLQDKLAAIEGAEAALVTASGMAAISTALLTVLHPGDRVLTQDCLYGGTRSLFTVELAELGITADAVSGDDPAAWERALRPETKAFYVESISNPSLRVPDLEAVVAFARSHGLVTLIDNTFPSPVNFRAAAFGFDLVLHSCTKYLNGHSDLVAGAVVGKAALVESVRRRLNHLGGSLDPHAAYLLERGMKTLGVRVRHQNESAATVARFLEAHPAVASVSYPGLASHPHHARAARLFAGFGGMIAFEPKGGADAAQRVVEGTRVFVGAPSLGGPESLVTRPTKTSHVGLPAEDLEAAGVTPATLRLSIGLEATEDLTADLGSVLG